MSVKRSDVVNLTGGVETRDGRTLYGMDAELYLKMVDKEDPEWEKKVAEWIEKALGEPLQTSDLSVSLKSGVILCRLANKIRPNVIPKFNNGKQIHALMEVENINLYLKACWRLGVPSSDLFTVGDLHMARGMPSVLQNIASLSRTARNSLGFKIDALGPSQAPIPINPVRKWEVKLPGKVNVVDLVDDGADSLVDVKRKLELAKSHSDVLEKELAHLKAENTRLRAGGSNASSAPMAATEASGSSAAGLSPAVRSLVEKLKKESETKSTLIKDLDDQCQMMEKHVKSLREENQNLKLAAVSQKTASSQASSVENQLRGEIDILKKQNDSQIAKLESQTDDLKKQVASLMQDNAKLKQSQTHSIQENNQQLTKLETEWKEKVATATARLTSQLKIMESKISEMEENGKTMLKENEDLRQRAAKQQSSAANAEEELKGKLELESSKNKRAIEQMQANADTLQRELDSLKSENAALKSSNVEGRGAEDTSAAREAQLRKDADLLKQQYTKRIDDLLQNMSRLEAEVVTLNKEKAQMNRVAKNDEERAAMRIFSLRNEVQEAKKQHQHDLSNLRDQLKQLEAQMSELATKNDALAAEASSTRSSAQQIEEDLRTELQSTKDKYFVQISELEKQSMILERKAHSLSQENSGLKDSIKENEGAAKERLEVLEQQMRVEVDEAKKRGDAAIKKLEDELDTLRQEKELADTSSAELVKANEDLRREVEETRKALLVALEPRPSPTITPTITPTMSPSSSSNNLRVHDSLSSISKSLNRRSVGKLDPKLLKIKHQLESGDGNAGDAAFYYEKNIDENLLMFAKDSISTIMNGQGSIVYDDMPQLNQLFKFDTGRRLFCFMLQYAVDKKEHKLTTEAFEVLLFLINSCLNELGATDMHDWNTISIFMDVAGALYQVVGSRKEYIKDIVRTHFIWTNPTFWEQHYWSKFWGDYKSQFGDKAPGDSKGLFKDKKQQEFVHVFIRNFGATMLFWGMKIGAVAKFMDTIAEYMALSPHEVTEAVASIDKMHKTEREAEMIAAEKAKKAEIKKKKSGWFGAM